MNPQIYDIEGRFIFYPNNKCGQTSITNRRHGALGGRCIVRKWCPVLWKQYRFMDDLGLVTFTVVRNPYERFLSACRHTRYDIDTSIRALNNLGFDLFDPHFRPQYPSLKADYVLRLENIDEDWLFVKDKIGANPRSGGR